MVIVIGTSELCSDCSLNAKFQVIVAKCLYVSPKSAAFNMGWRAYITWDDGNANENIYTNKLFMSLTQTEYWQLNHL